MRYVGKLNSETESRKKLLNVGGGLRKEHDCLMGIKF